VEGRGVEQDGVVVNERATFQVDARHAGIADLDVAVFDEDSGRVDVDVSEQTLPPGGVFECSYTARGPGRHSVNVTYGHVGVPQSPFKVSPHPPLILTPSTVVGRLLDNHATRLHFIKFCVWPRLGTPLAAV